MMPDSTVQVVAYWEIISVLLDGERKETGIEKTVTMLD